MYRNNDSIFIQIISLKVKIIIVIAVIIALVLGFLWFYNAVTAEESTITGTEQAKQVVSNMQLNTLTYYYTDSIFITEPEEWTLFGFDLDPGIRYLAVSYDGIIRLGLDFGEGAQNVNIAEQGVVTEDGTEKRVLKITLPEVVEISHEQLRNNEVTILQDGKYTKSEVSREKLNEAYAKRKQYFSENAVTLGLYKEAEQSAKGQISQLLNMVPNIRDEYVIRFGD
ncbi:MAG: DUF4230 domain-containing protein [Clostridiales bacterium]|jgi:hypothetical protein|nr:DUF4230 domain-containing protein [Clostridiales bacterium]